MRDDGNVTLAQRDVLKGPFDDVLPQAMKRFRFFYSPHAREVKSARELWVTLHECEQASFLSTGGAGVGSTRSDGTPDDEWRFAARRSVALPVEKERDLRGDALRQQLCLRQQLLENELVVVFIRQHRFYFAHILLLALVGQASTAAREGCLRR